jgi:hypothetical protein
VFADEPGFVPAIGAKFLFRYTKAFDSIVVGHQMDPEILLAHRKVVLRWLRLMFEICQPFSGVGLPYGIASRSAKSLLFKHIDRWVFRCRVVLLAPSLDHD